MTLETCVPSFHYSISVFTTRSGLSLEHHQPFQAGVIIIILEEVLF